MIWWFKNFVHTTGPESQSVWLLSIMTSIRKWALQSSYESNTRLFLLQNQFRNHLMCFFNLKFYFSLNMYCLFKYSQCGERRLDGLFKSRNTFCGLCRGVLGQFAWAESSRYPTQPPNLQVRLVINFIYFSNIDLCMIYK